MAQFHSHSEGFSGNNFASVCSRLDAQPCRKLQCIFDLFSLARRASRQGQQRLRVILPGIWLRHVVQLPARLRQRACRCFPVQAQSGVPRLHQRRVNRSHERIHAHVRLFVILIQGTERLRKNGRIQLAAILALEGYRTPQERGTQEHGYSLRTVIRKGIKPNLAPSLSIKR